MSSEGRPDEPDARTRIREAALDLIGRRGTHGTSTRDIIAAAGMRNPSAISYYFGSKAELVDDLVREVNLEQSAIIQQQVALAGREPAATPAEWAAVAVDAANGLLATERGCLLIRVWAERDELNPDGVEHFIASDHDLARAWRGAVAATFPDLPLLIAIGRNVIVLRVLQAITVRRARRQLEGVDPPWSDDPTLTRPFLIEVAMNVLTPPTAVCEGDLRSGT